MRTVFIKVVFPHILIYFPEAPKRSPAKLEPNAQREEADTEGQEGVDAPARERSQRLRHAPTVEPAQLRKGCNQILPLLADRDPGAKDCLKDNRKIFRSTFTPEAYVKFELGTGLE